jgi:class 3 adenylate cyclase
VAGASKKSLDAPDDHIEVGGIAADVVQIGDAAIARNVFQPGAHCALGGLQMSGNHRASQSCMAHHTGVLLEGKLHIEMDDGSTLDIVPNDVFDIPPGHDGWVTGDAPMRTVNWSGVRTWLPEPGAGERVLASVLVSDIVGSTEILSRIGDTAWRELLGQHNREVRNQLDRFRGREIKTTGDGFLIVFDGAGRAIRAAIAIRGRVRTLGLEVRQGIHTGEIEVLGEDVRGVAVHEAARIAAAASGGQILVSATTRALADGSEFRFDDQGTHELKGLSGARQLYSIADADGPSG